jgi:YHS domain-containing protein
MHCCNSQTVRPRPEKDRDPFAEPVCPVCGMEVENPKPKLVVNYHGKKLVFCADVCRKKFWQRPERCLAAAAGPMPKKKGIWQRYLERLTRATGGKEIKCH